MDPISKAIAKIKEEVEQIEEGTDKIRAEYDSLKKHDIKTLHGMIKQGNRVSDVSGYKTKDHAITKILRDKHGDKKVDAAFNESVEQIDELSKQTLGSYVKKASRDVAQRSASNARDYAKGDVKPGMNKKAVKNWKREIGIDKAVDKMTKEEVELGEAKVKPGHNAAVMAKNIAKVSAAIKKRDDEPEKLPSDDKPLRMKMAQFRKQELS